MEATVCVFNSSRGECRGPNRYNVGMLMCQKHLEMIYGLCKMQVQHERPTKYLSVGGFLRPSPGVIFSRNTVIVPTQKFFDITFRPEDLQSTGDTEQYQMNPIIVEFMNNSLIHKMDHNGADKRYMIEVIRNLANKPKDVNLIPENKNLMKNAVTLITTKLNFSESLIEKQSIYDHMLKNEILVKGTFKKWKDSGLSTCFCYLLNNIMYQSHVLSKPTDANTVTDVMMFNTEFVNDVGLVATEEIANPMPLIVAGQSFGNVPYYNSIVAEVKKEVLQRKVTPRDLPTQFAANEMFRGGNKHCL